MKTSLKKDTLAYQYGIRPAVILRDMSKVPLKPVVEKLNAFMEVQNLGKLVPLTTPEKFMGNPEVDAVIFYLMNHAVAVVRQRVGLLEPLGKYLPLLDMYHNELAVRSARMFYYLLLICSRESRHEKNDLEGGFWKDIKAKYPASIIKFHKSMKGKGSLAAASSLTETHTPECTLGQFTSYLYENFYTGKFNGGYGGKKWAVVAKVLDDFVHGRITGEMMMDTAFTLAHNGGPIFNKGMLFTMYGDELYKILDVQRAGMIPQYVAEGCYKWSDNKSILNLHSAAREIIGDEFAGYVDWYQVEALGSVKKYSTEKQKQDKKFGINPTAHVNKPAKTFMASVADLNTAMESLGKAFSGDFTWVQIMPTLKVKLIEIVR